MTLFEAIVLGLIQGLSEFIPISSSGHLVLAQHVFDLGQDHLFLEWINIGTLLALLVYFRVRIRDLLRRVFAKGHWHLLRNFAISVLPAGVIGFVFADYIAGSWFFSSPWVVALMLFVVGVFLVVLERLPRAKALPDAESLTPPRALAIGLAQAMALIPGTSRSGATIIAGRLAGLTPAVAAEYSFLLSIPVMLGVVAKLIVSDQAYLLEHWQPLLVSNIFAFISGLLAVGFLMNYLSRHTLAVFGWYRIALAVVVLVALLV